MADDLSAPLGQGKKRKGEFKIPAIVPQALAGMLALTLVGFAGWATVMDDPLGGEPMTVVAATAPADAAKQPDAAQASTAGPNRYDGPPNTAAAPATAPAAAPVAPTVPPGGRTVTVIDGSTGKRQDVVVPGNGAPVSGATPPAAPPEATPTGGDPRLLDTSRHGMLPRIGVDGTRPSEAYAKPVKPISARPDAPRIAIVVGGLGVSSTATNDAITKLPAAVTLAFAPYGNDVARSVMRARAEHEVLLQIPMEPHDYPDNDPGPQTLLASHEVGQNIDRMQWLMSRAQGYVGVVNFMGARFTSSEQALAPILKEVAKRGLIFFDDGTSQRSVAGQIAGANNMAFAKADVVLDVLPTASDIDRALGKLEVTARQRGVAIGMANALPVSLDRIARWARAAESRGILLVPISAVAAKAAKQS